MIEWLSGNYGVSINAVVFKYIRTKSGDELIARTMIIPEEVEKERSQKQQRKIPMSDEPGSYGDDEIETLLRNIYLKTEPPPRRIREIVLPLCLDHESVEQDEIKMSLLKGKKRKAKRRQE